MLCSKADYSLAWLLAIGWACLLLLVCEADERWLQALLRWGRCAISCFLCLVQKGGLEADSAAVLLSAACLSAGMLMGASVGARCAAAVQLFEVELRFDHVSLVCAHHITMVRLSSRAMCHWCWVLLKEATVGRASWWFYCTKHIHTHTNHTKSVEFPVLSQSFLLELVMVTGYQTWRCCPSVHRWC
jgi:hypothetical protein